MTKRRPADAVAMPGRFNERSVVYVNEILPYLLGDKYMSKRCASEYTGLCVNRLETAYRRGELRAFNCGRKILFLKSDIDGWIQSHEVIPSQIVKSARSELAEALSKAIERAKKNVHARRKGGDAQ